jgi:glutamate-1-semialdehyde 2,1-aminomutase
LNELIITLPFNDREALELALRSEGERVAAIITEPCMGNCGAINAHDGFLELIREQCTRYGIVFILDEVKTGFRIANGGALEVLGVRPDMVTWAKALANGYPLAAFGGKREIMSLIGHGVIHGGTFTNNKPGVAAAWATLTALEREPVLKTIEKRGTRLMEGIRGILTEASLPFCMSGFPSMFSYAIGIEEATDQRSWNKSDKKYFLELVEAMIQRGVMLDHDPREPLFMCYAHSEADVDMTLDVFRETIRSVKP